ncbi:hypothetical protein FA13DRAFT_1317509 [Coprinellus micaceus]|uniref:Uncharacterized protein n=1 Tax=Coprinellus micaceus TaxID=71717 RepID=A0A4Y7SRA6_COPMI|nr:hypothetical protein FA13DRAFT_1317509 [Coprinellus micaceus]
MSFLPAYATWCHDGQGRYGSGGDLSPGSAGRGLASRNAHGTSIFPATPLFPPLAVSEDLSAHTLYLCSPRYPRYVPFYARLTLLSVLPPIQPTDSSPTGTPRPPPSTRSLPRSQHSPSVNRKPPTLPLPEPGHAISAYKRQWLSLLQSTVTSTVFFVYAPSPCQ